MRNNKNIKRKHTKKAGNSGRTHGGYTQVTKYRGQKLDMRRRDDRALRAWQESIIADCGGPGEMDSYQASMLDRATEAMLVLRAMGQFVEHKVIVMKGGELVPCLRQSFVSYQNVFRLSLEAIYSRAGKKGSDTDLYEKWRQEYFKDSIESDKKVKK